MPSGRADALRPRGDARGALPISGRAYLDPVERTSGSEGGGEIDAEKPHGAMPPNLHLPLMAEAAVALFQVIAPRDLGGLHRLRKNLGFAC